MALGGDKPTNDGSAASQVPYEDGEPEATVAKLAANGKTYRHRIRPTSKQYESLRGEWGDFLRPILIFRVDPYGKEHLSLSKENF